MTGSICDRANIAFEDCNDFWESFVMKWNISNVIQRFFADCAVPAKKCRGFSNGLAQNDGHLY